MLKLWEWDTREHGWYMVGDKCVFGPLPDRARRPPAAQMYDPLKTPRNVPRQDPASRYRDL